MGRIKTAAALAVFAADMDYNEVAPTYKAYRYCVHWLFFVHRFACSDAILVTMCFKSPCCFSNFVGGAILNDCHVIYGDLR